MPPPKERFKKASSRIYCFADTPDLCQKLLTAGAKVIQFRNKIVDNRQFKHFGTDMMKQIRRYTDAVLIVNDRVDIALEIGADGIHVGQEDDDYREVLQRVPPEMIVGVSARYPALAADAERAGATYVGTGSVAATPSKPEAVVIGLQGLQAVVAAVTVPVVAIGGITAANIGQVAETGASFCAVISAVNAAEDPAEAFRRLDTLFRQDSAADKS